MDISNQISRAIKEAKWLDITYQNKQNETTSYWIAIRDIDPETRRFKVDMFNSSKSMNAIESVIEFDRIKSANVLNFCTYDGADKLADKIEAKKPSIVFEINGGEHFGVFNRERSDKAKMDICKKKGIKIIFIPNTFVKNYEYIVDIIVSSRNADAPIQQSIFDLI